MPEAIVVLFGLGIGFCIIFLLRNRAVYCFRIDMIEEIGRAAQKDIALNRAWLWRYDELQRVSYNEMLLQLWRPLRSFYPHSPAREME